MSQALTRYNKVSLPRRLYRSIKAAFQMRFGGYGGGQWGGAWSLSWGQFTGTRVNFASEAGKLVNSSLVMAAVNWLGRVMPEAPLRVVEMDADGKEKAISNHPAAMLLKRPNPFYSGAAMWKAFALSWIADGNPYFVKVRNGFGQVIELWWIPCSTIWPRWDRSGRTFIDYYEYEVDGRLYRLEVDDVLHFRDGADPENMGRTGLSGVASVLREVCADNEVAQYNYLLMKNGGVPPVVLALKDSASSVDFDPQVIKDTYIRSTQGDSRGKVFVSGNAVELTKVGFSPTEMDIKILRRLPEERFAAVIGIPAIVLGFGSGADSSTYNNTEQADERAIENYLCPLYRYVEDELTHQLGADFALTENQRFAFDLSKVRALQEDQDLLHKRAAIDLSSGGVTLNEYRAALSLPPDPSGDYYLRKQGVMAVSPEVASKQIEDAMNPPEPVITDNAPQLLNGRDRRQPV